MGFVIVFIVASVIIKDYHSVKNGCHLIILPYAHKEKKILTKHLSCKTEIKIYPCFISAPWKMYELGAGGVSSLLESIKIG